MKSSWVLLFSAIACLLFVQFVGLSAQLLTAKIGGNLHEQLLLSPVSLPPQLATADNDRLNITRCKTLHFPPGLEPKTPFCCCHEILLHYCFPFPLCNVSCHLVIEQESKKRHKV